MGLALTLSVAATAKNHPLPKSLMSRLIIALTLPPRGRTGSGVVPVSRGVAVLISFAFCASKCCSISPTLIRQIPDVINQDVAEKPPRDAPGGTPRETGQS